MKYDIILIICLIIFLIYFFRIYFAFIIIIKRGIIFPSKLWWKISDIFLPNNTLNNIIIDYYTGKKYINLFIVNFRVVNDINEVKKILYNTNNNYRTGKIKNKFFKQIMPYNIGVTINDNNNSFILWEKRREFNEKILDTKITHSIIIDYYKEQIKDICLKSKFIKADSNEYFTYITNNIVKLILCGNLNISNRILPDGDLFIQPGVSKLLSEQKNHSNKKEWEEIIKNTIINPISLLGRINNFDDNILQVYDQIPHWIFPIYGSITTTLVRALLLDLNCNIKNNNNTRNIILETLRLYNPVISLFRKDISNNEELLIFIQMFLRNEKYFNNPHCFYPDRWNDKSLEFQTYNLMFSQGPQICPGKNLILYLLEFLFDLIRPIFNSNKKLNCDYLPDSLNPFELFNI